MLQFILGLAYLGVARASLSGVYEGSVPLIIDITMDFSAQTVNADINVKVAHQEIKCPSEAVVYTDAAVTFPNIGNAGDCMGDALRGQKKDTSKYSLSINSDGTLTFHSDGYPAMKMKKKALTATALSGVYEGSVPFIIDITMDFSAQSVNADINVKVAHQEIKCPSEAVAYTDAAVTFPQIGNAGDCMGDALRGQKKDTSKYSLSINSDGTLTFHSDGYPAMKMKKKTLTATALSGVYEGSVPFIIDITMGFSAQTVNADINVKVAHQEIKCPSEAVAYGDAAVTFPNIGNAGDCMGDALRGQKKDTSKYSLSINSDGTLTFHSDGYPAMKMKKKALFATALSGVYEGSVPFIIDITMDFSAQTVNTDINVKVAHQEIKCPSEAVAYGDAAVTFPNIGNAGDCMGDALRGQKKDTSKYSLSINSDGTLTFHSDGYPAMKMKKKALTATALSGVYEGSVPFIIDITMDFSAQTVNADINVKVAHQEIKCPSEAVAYGDAAVTFPNIGNAGDCMGDALRGQKKDTSKYSLSINSDGTLTFHSDGYPAMKMKRKSDEYANPIVV